jgi:hypothetical protein
VKLYSLIGTDDDVLLPDANSDLESSSRILNTAAPISTPLSRPLNPNSETIVLHRIFIFLIISSLSLLPVAGCKREQPPVQPDASDRTDTSDDEPAKDTEAKATSDEAIVESYTETIPRSLVEFEMVLVPGDDEQGIETFYLGKREVSWNAFAYWALCEDLSEKKAVVLINAEARPSLPHDVKSIYRGWGRENQPALGLSRHSAMRYCEWLSEQTGRKYRLPTNEEWNYAFEKGGGQLETNLGGDALDAIAWHAGNSRDEKTSFNRAMPLGSKQPNALGIYDMLGNVAEWVTDSGEERVARGGHFRTPADEITGSHRSIEDQNVWNANYPNEPKTKWGYVDADFVGLRLACEP